MTAWTPLLFCVFAVGLFLPLTSTSVVKRESKPNHDKVVACYVSTWATYRQGHGTFNIEDIDPSLCTNLIYAFAGLNSTSSTIRSLDPYNDLEENYGKGSYKKMTALRKKYPHLTVSIAIGGWNEGSMNYSMLAADTDRRRIFVDSVVNFLKKHNFNGFDLDWEFPAKRGGSPQDKENFVLLVKDLHAALKPKGWLLTAALGAGKDTMEAAYDLAELDKYLDFIHLMCYDYHGKWDNHTGANAPLHSSDLNDPNTVEFSVNYMLENGVSPNKLVVGVPMYGRTFQLQDETEEERLGLASTATAFSGPYTQEDGFMGYNEICVELNDPNSSWKIIWDNASMTPFAKSGQKFIVYDNKESLKQKVIFTMKKQLGGVMIWSIDIDDFRGECVQDEESNTKHKFQLLHSVNEALSTYEVPEEVTEKDKIPSEEPTNDITTEKTEEPSTASIPIISYVLVLICGLLSV